MAIIRQIAQLGHPVLRGVAGKVAHPSDPSIHALIEDMLVTMIDANGVGIAAPQVYEPLALFIVASRSNPRYPDAPQMEPTAMINPELLWASEEKEKGWEGCLSIPGLRGLVPRHRRIGVRYLTREGDIREEEYADFQARVFQHEFDHIQGLVFIDRVESTRELVTEKEYVRLASCGG
ncbi:peptide deformylase [Pelotalea chapellei]|uniref:Peptide deformylase n=1 Tax=Pelotalea chapellei TaxID=44671 RepID=A0ABS5UCN3_9BACT|nr:peptide deformylase [Pelotalea chapellei]MBT1073403.1 peptide deformylase [Pelotalea chapellei]